ncbi:MAG: hypothetical protein ACIAQZ_08235 [Sedimentisphaeraceae bacterium JB056]
MRFGICFLIFSVFFCGLAVAQEQAKSGFDVNHTKKIEDIRSQVINKAESLAAFTWNEYAEFLDELKKDRYIVTTGKDFNSTVNDEKIVVYMRHDIDINPFAALKMAQMEKQRGICSTFYVLHSARYYGVQSSSGVCRYAQMDILYKKIAQMGHEIGVHNDLIGLMIQSDISPLIFQRRELDYYTKAGFDITGVVSHGSSVVAKCNLNNTWIFSEFGKKGIFENNGKIYTYGDNSFRDFGFEYEGYKFKLDQRAHDIGGKFTASIKGCNNFVDFLQKCETGQRISILTHPVWWGRNLGK